MKQNDDASRKPENADDSGSRFNRRTVLGATLTGLAGAVSPVSSQTSIAEATSTSVTAVSDGYWNDPATWEGGNVPTDGKGVHIADGVTVTIASEISTRVRYLEVAGTLRHAHDTDTKLRAETIYTKPGSRYEIGTNSTPIQSDVTAEVEFIDEGPIDEDVWPERKNKGLLTMGDIEIVGAEKTPWTALAQAPTAGDTAIELPTEPTNWNVGDNVVIPGIDAYSSSELANEDEERTIASISGTTVTFETALDYDHVPSKSGLDSYALNLTRNVVFFSENTAEKRRGHVMIMNTGSQVRYVQLQDLGRTFKEEYITDPVRNADSLSNDLDPNPAARYPLHWHRTGIDPDEPHEVEGAVVDGSIGWGIVNHHAYANVTDSITYDVLGAGFVAEGGNERGSFKRNFALRSTGSGEKIDSRSAGNNGHGGDPPIDDFGHAGHGFWLQSPLVEVVDNVAAGHRHYAYAIWTRPLLDGPMAECTTVNDSRVNYCPNLPMKFVEGQEPLLEAIDAERFSNNDQLMKDTQKIPSGFAKLRRFEGNEAFGSAGGLDYSRNQFKWEHERFSDFGVIDDFTVYNVGPHVTEDGELSGLSDPIARHRGAKKGGNMAIKLRYTTNVAIRNSWLIGNGDGLAVPFHDYLWTNVIEDSVIEDWAWGLAPGEHRVTWIRNNTFANNDTDVDWSIENNGGIVLDGNDLERVRYNLEYYDVKATELFDFHRSKGTRIDGRSVYWSEAAADYVPVKDQSDLDSINQMDDVFDDPSATIGLTNQELQDAYGVSVAGGLLDSEVVTEGYVDGGYLDPATERSPPDTVSLDAANASSIGAFEVVSETDAASNRCLRSTATSSPKDNPASISFECASGTYTLHARVRPDAWNGDSVYFRIDGGTWYEAEKLKSPIGFQWHDASPNGGESYTWELSEGTHTLEFACDNDGVRIDEVFLGSGEEVLGAYGVSASSSDAAPTVATEAATNVSETTATLNGSLDDLGGADTVEYAFEYRQTGATDWNTTSTQTLSATGSVSIDVTGLADGVDYEYRAVADASDGDTDTGSNVSFTTTDDPASVTTGSAADVDSTSATLSGSLDDLGNASSADCSFQYRQAGAESWSTTATQTRSATGSFSADVTGLADGVDYEYCAVAEASDGDSDTGSIVTFTTTDSAPAVTTESASNVSSTSATLNGSLDDLGNAESANCYFEYRQSGASTWTTTAAQTRSSTGSFSADVTGLDGSAEYEYRAVTSASDGDSATGANVTFTTTDSPPVVTTESASNVDATSTTLNGNLDDLGDAESVDCAFEFRQRGDDAWMTSPSQTLSSPGSFSASATGLADGVEYEYRAIANASDGDDETGSTVTFTTTDDPPAVTTGSPENVESTSVTLNGSLDDLGNADSVDCGFEIRQSGASTWTSTPTHTRSTTGSFSANVTGLTEGEKYEYRAVAAASDGDVATGSEDSFSTGDTQSKYTDHDLSRIQAEDFDTGGEDVAYWDTSDMNKGRAYRATAVDIQETDDTGGGFNIAWIEPGEWWEYTVDVPADGDYALTARVAGKNDTTCDVAVDGSQVATIDVPDTGHWQTWTTVDAGTVSLSAGTHVIRLSANGGSFNLNWFGFEKTDATTDGQAPYTAHDVSRIQAEDFDTGGEGVAYHDTSDGNNGGAYRDTNVDIQETDDTSGDYNLAWIEPGEWWEYTVDVPEDGEYDLSARLAGKNTTSLDVAVDGSQVATIDVPDTGDWQDWTTVEADTVSLDAGTHVIRLNANGGSFNLNWFGFE